MRTYVHLDQNGFTLAGGMEIRKSLRDGYSERLLAD